MIISLFGGRAAEELFFNKITSGSRDDLLKATNIIQNYIVNFGMSKSIGKLSFKVG